MNRDARFSTLAESRPSTRESGMVLVVASLLAALGLALMAAMTSITTTNLRVARESYYQLSADYTAQAALHAALAELASMTDTTGDGLGAMGLTSPAAFADATGEPLAEFRTMVTQSDERIVVSVVAAIPSFANARYTSSLESLFFAEESFPFAPKDGAMSIVGPYAEPVLRNMGEDDLVDGDSAPGLAVTSADTLAALIDWRDEPTWTVTEKSDSSYFLADADMATMESIAMASDDGSTVTEPSSSSSATTSDTLTIESSDAKVPSADELDSYREDLRAAAIAASVAPDRKIDVPIVGDQIWGTSSTPQVTVIDAGAIGASGVFTTDGQTIRGAGTLIIHHGIQPGANGVGLDLEWEGDVIIVGYEEDDDEDELLGLIGSSWRIQGNLVVLGATGRRATLGVRGSTRTAQLRVTGSAIVLADAFAATAELEASGGAEVRVDGLLGLGGARVEVETLDAAARLGVRGSILTTVAADLAAYVDRTEDLVLDFAGTFSAEFDRQAMVDGLDGLAKLQARLGTEVHGNSIEIGLVGAAAGTRCAETAIADFESRIAQQSSASLALDLDALVAAIAARR